jgi:hypothetical protein
VDTEALEKLSQRIAELENCLKLDAESRDLLNDLKAERKARKAAAEAPPPPIPAEAYVAAPPKTTRHPWLE